MKSKFLLMVLVVAMLGAGVRAQLSSEPAQTVDPKTPGYPGGDTIQPPPPTSTVSTVISPQPIPETRPLPDAKIPKSADLRALLEKFADAQLAAENQKGPAWQQGIFLSGAMALDGVSASPRFRDAVSVAGAKDEWKSQDAATAYGDAWLVSREPKMIAAVRADLDALLPQKTAAPAKLEVKKVGGTKADDKKDDATAVAEAKPEPKQRWETADGLLRFAPVWARVYSVTGQKKYRDALVKRWKETSDLLFNAEGSLYHRDSAEFDRERAASPRSHDGMANASALAGLARVLQLLPDNDPARDDIADQFKTIARKLVEIRLVNGGWSATLTVGATENAVDPAVTALISFGLASGINQGLLKADEVQPVVAQAWGLLAVAVKSADKANPDALNTLAPHAAGGLLMTGAELYRMALIGESFGAVQITVANSAALTRQQETIELAWDAIAGTAKMATADSITLFDAQNSRILDTQALDANGDQIPDGLLLQSDFLPGQTKRFIAIAGPNRDQQPQSPLMTFGRFVPERVDDFAWENDRIAYRVYGPALLKEPGEIGGSGIDVWCKSVRRPVVDKWYATDDYAADKGEGCDFFRVGSTRGIGGSGIIAEGRIAGASVFAKWKLLANGPIRTVFELEYDAFPAYVRNQVETNAAKVLRAESLTNELHIAAFEADVAEKLAKEDAAEAAARRLSEKKTFTLERGANLNKITSTFSGGPSDGFPFVTGIATQPGDSKMSMDEKAGWLTYTAPDAPPNGSIHGALVCVNPFSPAMQEVDDHHVIRMEVSPGQLIPYYAGAGWSKGPDFPTHEAWTAYVKNFTARLAAPLAVTVK